MAVPISPDSLDDDQLRPSNMNYLIAAEGDTTVRAAPSAQRRTSATDRVVFRRIGKDLLAIEREIPPQVLLCNLFFSFFFLEPTRTRILLHTRTRRQERLHP